MPIFDNEIIWRASVLMSDAAAAQNGGRMSFSQLVSGVKNNLFPDVSQTERLSGAVKWRKAFIHVNSAQDTALLNVRLFLDALTPVGDFVTYCAGTQTDTENQITSRPYGIGALYQAALSGATQIQVACEHNAEYASLQPLRVGDLIRVCDRLGGGGGAEEWVTLSGVSYGADFAVLDLATPLSNSFGTANTLVSSVLQLPSVAGNAGSLLVTSALGNFDQATVGNLVAHKCIPFGYVVHPTWRLASHLPSALQPTPETGSTEFEPTFAAVKGYGRIFVVLPATHIECCHAGCGTAQIQQSPI